MNRRNLDELQAAMEAIATSLEPPQPVFHFSIGWSDSYDSLLGEGPRMASAIDSLLQEATRRGRVLLHAEGGTGKTSILQRLFLKAVQDEQCVFLVDLKNWRPPLFDAWESWRGNDVMRMRLILRQLTQPSTDEDVLASVSPGRRWFLLVDGINEVPISIGQQILDCLDAHARRHPASAVVATDRLVRRTLKDESWGLARIERLHDEEIGRVLNREETTGLSAGLLGTAFFLDLAIKEGLDSTSGSVAFRTYLQQHVGLGDIQISLTARAAFQAYSEREGRIFDLGRFKALAGEEAFSRLITSGTVLAEQDLAYFEHHLFHDYFASFWLAENPTLWSRESFDAITFHASSFDALALALEQLQDAAEADGFLRKVYDWNFYGSAYALARGRNLGSISVSEEMEIALLAALAERRWDPIKATSLRVTDALRLFPSEVAARLLNADDLQAVFDIVREADLRGLEFRRWGDLFMIVPGSEVPDDVVQLVSDRDSITGWTAANVLKRVRLTDSQATRLRELLARDPDETVRWRVAHALGAHPSPQTVSSLFEALTDRDHWVRYGAIRSLVECAARDATVREGVFERIRARIAQLVSDEQTLKELERALLLADPPADWAQVVEPTLEELWATAETIELQDRWRRLAYEVHRAVSPARVRPGDMGYRTVWGHR